MAGIGGLSESFYCAAWLIYLYFGTPFRDLHLAVSFNKLISKINQKNDILYNSERFNAIYERHMNCCFYLKYFVFKRMPSCLHCCFNFEEHDRAKANAQENN